jgi:hypothetical protein
LTNGSIQVLVGPIDARPLLGGIPIGASSVPGGGSQGRRSRRREALIADGWNG